MRWCVPALLLMLGCASLPAPVRESAEAPPVALPEDTDDPLTLAAECLARGDEPSAAKQFEIHVRKHPEQVMFRMHLADLLMKIHRVQEAQQHYERFIADVQDSTGSPKSHLVHCHTRLMEVAQLTDDHFAELLHRGIGLTLLTRQETDDSETREGILCKAIKTLLEAKERRPRDARVHVYLAEAYERAGNRRAAEVSRATARNLVMPGALTPHESRGLALE